MIATSLSDIAFPVFRLGVDKPNESDGILYYYYEVESDEGIRHINLQIVDDKTINLPTLAKRRLHIKTLGAKLFRPKVALFFLGDLIKLANPRTWFIDSKGKLFQYIKTKTAKLKTYKIKQLHDIKGGGVIVEIEGSLTRFKSLFRPSNNCSYAGILHLGMSQILYAFYEQKHDDTWRKV